MPTAAGVNRYILSGDIDKFGRLIGDNRLWISGVRPGHTFGYELTTPFQNGAVFSDEFRAKVCALRWEGAGLTISACAE